MMVSDNYGKEEIEAGLRTAWAGRTICAFDELDSTNLEAKRLAEEGAAHGTLVTAGRQTAGRGRRGRGWSSPPDKNIYFTILLRPQFAPDKASILTLVIAHSVARVLTHMSGKERAVGIKWPNDIVADGKKVCGILTEMSAAAGEIRYVVVGVGINVRRQEFPPEVAGQAVSLDEAFGYPVDRGRLTADIMNAFEEDYEKFAAAQSMQPFLETYNALLVNRGREVRVLDPKGEYEGEALGIDENGELLIKRPDGIVQKVYAGEVSVRGIYGYV